VTGTAGGDDGESSARDPGDQGGEKTQLWLVERTYSDDEQNIIILVYATLDGQRYHRKERAITSFSSGLPDVTAAVTVGDGKIGDLTDAETRERYAEAARSTAASYDPDDPI
jgi:hypothetical protein